MTADQDAADDLETLEGPVTRGGHLTLEGPGTIAGHLTCPAASLETVWPGLEVVAALEGTIVRCLPTVGSSDSGGRNDPS